MNKCRCIQFKYFTCNNHLHEASCGLTTVHTCTCIMYRQYSCSLKGVYISPTDTLIWSPIMAIALHPFLYMLYSVVQLIYMYTNKINLNMYIFMYTDKINSDNFILWHELWNCQKLYILQYVPVIRDLQYWHITFCGKSISTSVYSVYIKSNSYNVHITD